MQTYRITMKNPKSGAEEIYTTKAETKQELEAGLSFLREHGYEIIACQPQNEAQAPQTLWI